MEKCFENKRLKKLEEKFVWDWTCSCKHHACHTACKLRACLNEVSFNRFVPSALTTTDSALYVCFHASTNMGIYILPRTLDKHIFRYQRLVFFISNESYMATLWFLPMIKEGFILCNWFFQTPELVSLPKQKYPEFSRIEAKKWRVHADVREDNFIV